MTPTIRRVLWEQRVRTPLVLLLVAVFAFVLVALFSTSDAQTQALENQPGDLTTAFRLLGLDPLAAWVSLGQVHPIFLVGSLLFALGLGVRAVAGELEAGSLELTLARPITRHAYLAAYVAVLVPGCLLIALGYATGAMTADRVFDPPGQPLAVGRMVVAAGLSTLLLLSLGALALLVSARSSERGRALAWTVGVTIVMYAANFLLPLWSPLEPLSYLSLFRYFVPGPTIQRGDVPWGDVAVLAGFTAAALSAAFWAFARRDVAA